MKKVFIILGILIAVSAVILSAGCVQEKVVVTTTPTATPVVTATATPVPTASQTIEKGGYQDIYADEVGNKWDDYYTERVTYYVSNKGTATARNVAIKVDAVASEYYSQPIDASARVSVGTLEPGEGCYVDAVFYYANARDSDDLHSFSVTTECTS